MDYSRKIAVPITARSVDDALYDMGRAEKVAGVIELRLDYIEGLRRGDLERLVEGSRKPKIATCRISYEGGRFRGTELERYKILQHAADLGVEYVDVENRYMLPIDRKSSKMIVSYHNFGRTPDDAGLRAVYRSILSRRPDVVKMTTRANVLEDGNRMLRLVREVSDGGMDVIGICMGRKGVRTRTLGLLAGGHLTFASLEKGKESASGQMTAAELRDILESVGP